VDGPAEKPCNRHHDPEAGQDETTELPYLLPRNAVGKERGQFVRLDVRRMHHQEVIHDAPPQ
jgi:hypothetical protein